MKITELSVKILFVGFILSFYACQSEQNNWVEGLEDKKSYINPEESPTDLDRQLAYIHRFPRDTIRNINIVKKSILSTLKNENEELTYKLILWSLNKYPKIIKDKEMEQLTLYFYESYLKEQETIKWISEIIRDKSTESEKVTYFNEFANQIKKDFPGPNAFHDSKQILSMAKIHSILFPENENSPEFLWTAYEIMYLTGSSNDALNVLELILIKHKGWINIKDVKREKRRLIKIKTSSKWLQKEKLQLEQPRKTQAPVS